MPAPRSSPPSPSMSLSLALLRPLVMGVAAVRKAVDALAADAAVPDVATVSPSVRELWLAVGRWARASRQKLGVSEIELERGAGRARGAARSADPARRAAPHRARQCRRERGLRHASGRTAIWRWRCAIPRVLAAADAVLRGEPAAHRRVRHHRAGRAAPLGAAGGDPAAHGRGRRGGADACTTSPRSSAASGCAPISSPMPATSCARRSPR